ncbi:MAG: sigma-70 family RNA polymerase sigma factor, partial [Patescibacteria group bacterium]
MNLKDTDKYLELIEKAKCGCRESMGELSKLVHAPIYSYIHRLTLDAALSEDLVQETLLEMFKSLKNLKNVKSFKAWLYRTALGKVQHHYRSKANKFHLSMQNKHELMNGIDDNKTEGLKDLISKEIAETLVVALAKLNMKHRNALVLRCYENMSYADI